MRKKIFITLLFTATSTMLYAQKGWVSLFDGKTTAGWHTYGKSHVTKGWKAENGVLRFDPSEKDGGDIVTDKEYENFHLRLEWKVSPKANSGIIFYVHEDPKKYGATYSTGPEMQILDNDGHADGKITTHRAGDLYDLVQSSSEPVKPVGQWNKVEIIASKGNLEFKMNGQSIVKTTMWDQNWADLLAKSKFATWKDFGTFKKGKIALQDHGDEIWFRNIEIKEL